MGLYDVVPVPMMGPEGVLKYLRDSLPEFGGLFATIENLGPYSYSTPLAEEMFRRQDDTRAMESFCSVLNEMAASHEFWMQEVFGDLLEALAYDEALVAKLRTHLNAQAREHLEAATGYYNRRE